ncbi:MAG: response regulator transcription factor [Actinomycetota bacterium]|nr:response regulator transcription factor [Actinomycetota bacterium]
MKRVIVIEDHSIFAQALELVLGRTNGTEVVLARTVEEGRSLIRDAGRCDLVVLDLMLPDGQGTELVAEVRRQHPDTPVAILSASDDVAKIASEAGADAAIPKATPLPSIISSLERLAG